MAKYRSILSEFIVLGMVFLCFGMFAYGVSDQLEDTDYNSYDLYGVNDLTVDGDSDIGGDETVAGDSTVTGTVEGGTVTDGTFTTTAGVTSTTTLTVTDIATILNYLAVQGIYSYDTSIGLYLSNEIARLTGTLVLDGGTYDTGLKAGTPTESVTYTLPPADGNSDEVVRTDGSAGLTFKGVGVPRTGWPVTPGVTLSFSYPTFTVTDGGSAYYYHEGTRYVLGGNKTVDITDTEGEWYIYFDGATLTSSQTRWTIREDDKTLVAQLYWNAADDEAIYVGYELHGYDMSGATHYRMHYGPGSTWSTGFLVSDAGTEDINVTAGNMLDEDITVFVTDSAGGGLWEEVLTPAELPIFYRQLATAWRIYDTGDKVTTTDVGFIDAGNALCYNKLNGTWQPTATTTGEYVAYWVVATSEQTQPVSLIMGQRVDGTEALAKVNNIAGSLILTGLPFEEMIYLARVIVKNTAGAPYYSVEDIEDLRNTNQTGNVTTPLTSAHGVLGGLSDDDHVQYLLANATRALTTTWYAGADFNIYQNIMTALEVYIVDSATRMYKNGSDFMFKQDGYAAVSLVQITSAVAASHTQGTDTTLGTMTADIDMDGSYQVVGLQAPAASGEAIRQTATITETAVGAAVTHTTSTGADHSYIDQLLTTIGIPTFRQITASWAMYYFDTATWIYRDPSGILGFIDAVNGWVTLSQIKQAIDNYGSGGGGTTIDADQINAADQIYNIGAAYDLYCSDEGNISTGGYQTFGDDAENTWLFPIGVVPTTGVTDAIQLCTEDPNTYTVLQLSFDGADGATDTTDDTGRHTTFVFNGTCQIDTAQKKFGTASLLPGAWTNQMDITDNLVDFNLGTNDFTIEFWTRLDSVAENHYYWGSNDSSGDSTALYWINGTGRFTLNVYNALGYYELFFYYDWSPSINTWYHVAVVREGDTWTIYVDGTELTGKTKTDGAYTASMPDIDTRFFIYGDCWVDEWRISKGIARYIDDFIAPTAAFSDVAVRLTLTDAAGATTSFLPVADNEELRLWVAKATLGSLGSLDLPADLGVTTISSKAGTNVRTTLGTDAGDDKDIYDGSNVIWKVEGDTKAMIIPYQPSFRVRPASIQSNMAINTYVTIIFGTEKYDQGGDFASNVFTAPATGKYQFNTLIEVTGLDKDADAYYFRINGSNADAYEAFHFDPGVLAADPAYWSVSISGAIDMDAADTCEVQFYSVGGAAQVDVQTASRFSGFLEH